MCILGHRISCPTQMKWLSLCSVLLIHVASQEANLLFLAALGRGDKTCGGESRWSCWFPIRPSSGCTLPLHHQASHAVDFLCGVFVRRHLFHRRTGGNVGPCCGHSVSIKLLTGGSLIRGQHCSTCAIFQDVLLFASLSDILR